MSSVCAALAVALFGAIAWRVATALLRDEGPAARAAIALVLGAALSCGSYSVLGQLCERAPAEIELVFHGDAIAAPRTSMNQSAGEVRVIEDQVHRARATPEALLVCALVLGAVALAARRKLQRAQAIAKVRPPSLLRLLYVPIALSGLAAILSTPRGYDALWYHLPMAAAFARSHHLEPPGRDLVFYFPANIELLARTLYDVLGRMLGPSALALVQLPFAFAVGPLTAALARRLGAGRAAAYAGALAVACPMLVFQAGLAYADVVALGSLAAALLLLLRALEVRGPLALTRTFAAGLCLGLSLGGKYAVIPLVATLVPVLFIAALASSAGRRIEMRNAPRALALVCIFFVGVIVPAWFWYVRNVRLTGNPIFPIAVPSLGLRGLFTGDAFNRGKELELVAHRVEWLAYPWLENLSHESGFGAAFAALVPLSLVPLALSCVRALRRGRLPRFFLSFGWGIAYLVAWWFGTPHEVRHLLPIVVLLGAPATLLLRGSQARGLTNVVIAALGIGAILTLRLQLFTPLPEQSVQRTTFEQLYSIPPDVLAALPPAARVANLAGRPYNLALLGPGLQLLPYEFAPGSPSDSELAYRGATHVFLRGPQASIEASVAAMQPPARPWRVVYRGVQKAARTWAFWGASATDTVILYEREEPK